MFNRYKLFKIYFNLVKESLHTAKIVKPFSSNKLLSANYYIYIKNYDCSIQH